MHHRLARFSAGFLSLIGVTLSLAAAAAPAPALLVTNALLLPCDPAQPSSFNGYLAVGSDGRILALGAGAPSAALAATAVKTLDVGGKIVAPGFISAHSHLYMSPLRGLGHDQTLYGWFQAWDRYLKHATPDDIYAFTLHGSLDFLRNGITTAYDFTDPAFGDFADKANLDPSVHVPPYSVRPGPFEERQMDAKIDAGLRFINSMCIAELSTAAATRERWEKLLAYAKTKQAASPLFLKVAISGMVQFLPDKSTATTEALYMRDYGLLNQSHFLEAPEHVAEQQLKFDWYVEAGALGPNFIFGHFIHTNDRIIEITAKAGAKMSWQPTSNGRLADGYADIVKYRKAGIPVAMGLDDQSCTDVPDPFQNLRIGLYTTRAIYKDAKVLSVPEILHLHTLGSAEVLGIADQVGSLTPGKWADFLIVDPRSPDTGPVYDPVATYVLACDLRSLKQVYVAGQLKVEGLTLIGVDEPQLRRDIDTRTDRLRAAAASTSRQ